MLQRLRLNLVWSGVISSSIICLGGLAAQSIPGLVSPHPIRPPESVEIQIGEQEQDRQSDPGATEQEDAEKAKLVAQRAKAQARTAWTNPASIAGHEKCIDCHKTEIKSWLASKHSSRAFDLLRTSETALEYATNLHIRPADIAKSSLCVNCHATPQLRLDQKIGIIPGVSCESCHNAAGGDNGWLNTHAVYGFAETRRKQESAEHFALRAERCKKAGQLRSANLYGLTKRCFDCHVIGDEALSVAGHTHGDGFEMVARSLGEVRHNFVLNENENAKISTLWSNPLHHGQLRNVEGRLRVMFIVGQMIDLEVSFRNLARASGENDFSDAMLGRIEDAFEVLAEDILEEVEDAEYKDDDQPDLSEIKAIVDIVTPVWESLDDDGFNADNAKDYIAAADEIAVFAKTFARRDGAKLVFLDELDLLPEDFFAGAYDPNPETVDPSSDQ